MRDPYQIVQTLLVTEKATELMEDFNKYAFKVACDSNKIEIRDAVEALFDVTVTSVNVMNRQGKRKRLRRANFGKRADWKKAIVTLDEDSGIDIL
ncbi:MAG: 50S ribosomal protein L23 [Lentisphaerae bacterium]|mgnify:CR=1 FL=1|jgi:large subunit ribosomal protein L23|nr:50S ribosomal protein L23 [Lentisphaerota bacterium]MBT4822970.1 50S ribosomal protein L23 [Lentisphaerota bacterium]MBT5609436.1 50S ribosomal protein L23 [Lentisphaerota bacterium]MBT7061243.1 50S ribosomal protein L23 [Lentisphaerota bacterium]MBT7848702.1 50S ribosomal protein L23 [Lentisphaerota bacterium]